jgi:hypothetical protein
LSFILVLEDDDELDLNGIDDAEIDSVILTTFF